MAPSLRCCASKSIRLPILEQSLRISAGIHSATIRCPPAWFRDAGAFASSISTVHACARSVWPTSWRLLRSDAALGAVFGAVFGRTRLFRADAEPFHFQPPIRDVACKPRPEAVAVARALQAARRKSFLDGRARQHLQDRL